MSFKTAHLLAARCFTPPRRFMTRCFALGAVLAAGCSLCAAQEVVHAMSGVVTKVDSATHSITLTASDGTSTVFHDETTNHPRYDFDKALQSDATDTSAFNKQGDRVILYYFGEGWQARAVAIKDLGPSPLKLASGEVAHWDHHRHVITIKAADGTKQTFQLDDKTAVETPMGVVNGEKFSPQNGDQVSIKYLNKNGDNQAVFLGDS